jgi:hypothetical protein
MRNLFDQYNHPENRLTHALACCLGEDYKLLKHFVRWSIETNPPTPDKLEIIEQQLPGEEETSEEEAEERGLPDTWIHNGDTWALLIENKVASPISADQLRRHRTIAERRNFKQIFQLAITLDGTRHPNIRGVKFLGWPEVYRWFCKQASTSDWALKMKSYMEAAEAKMVSDDYLHKGTLTEFSGVPFDEKTPYNYQEAKRILGLAMEKLRLHPKLQKELGIDPKQEGRPAITGQRGSSVWDYLPLKAARAEQIFTRFPHLTLSIQQKRIVVVVILPNGIKPEFRQNIIRLGPDGFTDLVMGIESRLSKAFREVKGAVPWMEIIQRHFPTQRSASIEDARLEFDLRTARNYDKKLPIKQQPQWLTTVYHVLKSKKGNLQIGIGAAFPYRTCKAVHTSRSLDLFAKAWLACKPILDVSLGKH